MATRKPQCDCRHRYLHHPGEGACTECECQKYRPKPRRTKGDGALYQRADGMWMGRVELPRGEADKRRYKTVSSKDRNVAIRELKKLRTEIDAGRLAVTGNTTVEKWLQRWVDTIHGPKLRPGTKDDYARTIRLHINPHIGARRLDKLTAEDVRQMQTAIDSSRTAQLAHIILNRALKDAVLERLITYNVAEVAEKPRHVTEHRKPLTAEQGKQLLRSAINNNDPWATRWGAALLLGARQGEVLGLQWERADSNEIGLDLEAGIAAYEWQLQQLNQIHGCGKRHDDETWPCGRSKPGYCPQRQWAFDRGFEYQVLHRSLVLTRPKTKAGVRVVPLPAPLWAMLQQHPRGDTNPHNLVWHHHDGRPVDPRADYDNWQTALETAGLPPAPLHVARNTCATLLAQAGVPEDVRMAILGQVSITAHRAYVYRDQSVKRQAMTAMDQLLS